MNSLEKFGTSAAENQRNVAKNLNAVEEAIFVVSSFKLLNFMWRTKCFEAEIRIYLMFMQFYHGETLKARITVRT